LSKDPSVILPQQSLVWYRAVTLAERLPGRLPGASNGVSERSTPRDDERLEHTIRYWKAQPPFDRSDHFQERLCLEHLTEDALRQLIAEPLCDLRSRLGSVPGWVTAIETALSSRPAFEFHDFLTERLKRNPTVGFLDVVAPFINLGLRQLEAGAVALSQRLIECPFEPASVGGMLFPELARALLAIVSRTLVLELNVARLEGTLIGSTPEERFASFLTQLRDPARLRVLLEEYPVLARLVAEQTRRWVAVGLELLERASIDCHALERSFAGTGPLGSLTAIAGGLGDPHAGGRSVAILTFSSGTRIVYKPKLLAVDAHFQDLLRWLTAEGCSPGFRTLTILDRGSYGWVEFVVPRECQSPEDVVRFYERVGWHLALLYLTDATDLHAGNVIASGEHPVFIDLEAAFHPHRTSALANPAASAGAIAARFVRSSVRRTGLLPERLWGNEEHDGVDISGLGAVDGQLTPHGVAAWEDAGTDAMRLVRRRKTMEADRNRPMLEGQPVDPTAHREAILRGFRSAYSMLVARRDVLLSPAGPLHRFAHDHVSVFLRSSRTYRRLLRESYHPDVLRDALDRDRLFDRLWIEVPGKRELTRVIRAEQDDLWNGDIPFFTSRPGSRELSFGAGEPLSDFFPEPSLSAVSRNVARMGEADCARQLWYIEASLASLPTSLKRWPSYPVPSRSVRPAPACATAATIDHDRLLGAALAVGDRLDELAVRGVNDASWIGLELERRRAWSIAGAGLDLDAGVPGIALFLAYLGHVTGRPSATALAQAALATMRSSLAERGPSLTNVGGFEGLGGVIYVLSHLATLWGRTDLAVEADVVASRLPEVVHDDDDFDVFGGAAGCILALRSLQQCLPLDRVTAVAVTCGDHLLDSAVRSADRIGWPGISCGPTRRSGLAFGAAGIAYALLELHSWTGIERFRATALDMLDGDTCPPREPAEAEHEGQHRADSDRASHGGASWTAWCHGTGGVDLARLCWSDATTRGEAPQAGVGDRGHDADDIVAIAERIRDLGFGTNHSLCHGDLGSLEFLARAAATLGDPALTRETAQMAATIVNDIERNGWRCGTPLGVETPGLLAGLAGIGYGLLRTARPDMVPSVLMLEPPGQSSRAHVR
jgi:type 2 lantibiotic biosynthesis protein LanM